MKAFLRAWLLVLRASALPISSAVPPEPYSLTPGSPIPEEANAMEARWNIAVDVQMLALPLDLGLLWLPELQSSDTSKVEAAVAQLQDLLKKKQAVLLGWPRVFTADRQSADSQTQAESRYPSEFSPPLQPQTFSLAPPPKLPLSIVPHSMETRNAGISLEVTPVVMDPERGNDILIGIRVDRSIPLAFESYELGMTAEGHFARIAQPRFAASKTATTILMRSGERTLIGVHLLVSPKNYLEVVIARAVATKTR